MKPKSAVSARRSYAKRTWQTLPCSKNAILGSGSSPVRSSTPTFLLAAVQTGAAALRNKVERIVLLVWASARTVSGSRKLQICARDLGCQRIS